MAISQSDESLTHHARWFTTTHWSVVLAAREAHSPQAANALNTLCQTYWRPLYSFVRRQGYGPESAEDLNQSFFTRLLAKNHLVLVRHQEGKFRSFLLTLLKNYLSDERDKARPRWSYCCVLQGLRGGKFSAASMAAR